MIYRRCLFPVFIFIFIKTLNGLDVVTLSGRKDADSCCDKLENNTFSTNCQQTLLIAEEDEKFAYSPGFPGQFPMQKLCSWGIYAEPNKRVRIEFPDFYLIGPGDDGVCFSQGVVIESPLTGREMGPHCGNAGLPVIVSPGNYVIIKLISNIPMTAEGYRGFKMSYRDTIETPSHELRPPDWDNDVMMTADPLMVEKLFPAVLTPPPKRKTKPTRKSSRFLPPRRPGVGLAHSNTYSNKKYAGYITPQMKFPMSKPPNKSSTSLNTEVIVGIIIGCVIVLAIIILIAVTCRQARKSKVKTEKNARNKAVNKNENSKKSSGEQQELDEMKCNLDSAGVPQVPGYYFYYYDEGDGDNNLEKNKASTTKGSDSPALVESQSKHSSKRRDKRKKLYNSQTKATTRPARRRKKREAKSEEQKTGNPERHTPRKATISTVKTEASSLRNSKGKRLRKSVNEENQKKVETNQEERKIRTRPSSRETLKHDPRNIRKSPDKPSKTRRSGRPTENTIKRGETSKRSAQSNSKRRAHRQV